MTSASWQHDIRFRQHDIRFLTVLTSCDYATAPFTSLLQHKKKNALQKGRFYTLYAHNK